MSAIPQIRDATHEFQLLINGQRTPGAATLDVINPATGKLLTTCARADKAQLDAAVAAAKSAFPAWAATPDRAAAGGPAEDRRCACRRAAPSSPGS